MYGMNKYSCERCSFKTYNLLDVVHHEIYCFRKASTKERRIWIEKNFWWKEDWENEMYEMQDWDGNE